MAKFQTINRNTKRAQGIIYAYEHTNKTSLRQAYPSHYSSAKEKAFNDCLAIMKEHHGREMRITGASSYQFSCACKGYDENGRAGLIYFTATANYFIPCEEAEGMAIEEFESRWNNNVSDDIKERTARALNGRIITNEDEAIEILKMAEMFTAMQKLVK